jgi:hypothetical protein
MRNRKFVFITVALTIVCFRALSQDRPISIERDNYGWWTSTDAKINMFADSLNFWSTRTKLPGFLSDDLLDLSLKIVTSGDQKSELISIRKAIFDRVINENILEEICRSSNLDYDKLYNPKELLKNVKPSVHGPVYPELPYMKYSTRELAERRLRELRKIKERFNKKER